MGISQAIELDEVGDRGRRVARCKSRHETYRRLLEYLGR